jgi:hypothetical protein
VNNPKFVQEISRLEEQKNNKLKILEMYRNYQINQVKHNRKCEEKCMEDMFNV